MRRLLGIDDYFRKYISNFITKSDKLISISFSMNFIHFYIIILGRLSAAGQRLVNELAEFSFQLHVSPGKQNVIAYTFIRPSANTYIECMRGCTKLISSD